MVILIDIVLNKKFGTGQVPLFSGDELQVRVKSGHYIFVADLSETDPTAPSQPLQKKLDEDTPAARADTVSRASPKGEDSKQALLQLLYACV